MGAMSVSHWLIVLIVVVLFFGPKKLPNIGKSLGEGMRALREGLSPQEEAKPEEKGSAEKASTEKKSKKDEDDATAV
jgi:sec-independent protein translocase protein TatA